MLLFVSLIKLVAEIALGALLGQALLGWLIRGGAAQQQRNGVYRVLQSVAKPWVVMARAVLPRSASAAAVHGSACAAGLLLWLAAAVAKVSLCVPLLGTGVAACA